MEIHQVVANGSRDGDGVEFEEWGDGDFEDFLSQVEITRNWQDGLEIGQWNAGQGTVKIRASTVADNDVENDGNDDLARDGVEADVKGGRGVPPSSPHPTPVTPPGVAGVLRGVRVDAVPLGSCDPFSSCPRPDPGS